MNTHFLNYFHFFLICFYTQLNLYRNLRKLSFSRIYIYSLQNSHPHFSLVIILHLFSLEFKLTFSDLDIYTYFLFLKIYIHFLFVEILFFQRIYIHFCSLKFTFTSLLEFMYMHVLVVEICIHFLSPKFTLTFSLKIRMNFLFLEFACTYSL